MHKVDNLPPSCAVVTKSGKMNFLEPFGLIHACNGTALPFFTLQYKDVGEVLPLADEFDRKRGWLKKEAVQ